MGTPGNGWSGLSALSADEQFIAFASTASNLVGRDANHSGDIFLMERLLPATTGDPEAVLSTGLFHTCALKPNGQVDCWGQNTEGQTADPPGPFAQVSDGGYHTCAPRTNGEVACGGSNQFGQSSPPAGPFVQVSSGRDFSCGLRPDGGVACWGDDYFGLIEDHPIPFGQISAGARSVCGQSSAGRVWCWGGDDSAIGAYVQISVGGGHVCGLRASGTINCWGQNSRGEAEHPDGVFSQVTLGYGHSCALGLNGQAVCWGYDAHGQTTPAGQPPWLPGGQPMANTTARAVADRSREMATLSLRNCQPTRPASSHPMRMLATAPTRLNVIEIRAR